MEQPQSTNETTGGASDVERFVRRELNALKRRCYGLEMTVQKLVNVLSPLGWALDETNYQRFSCGACGNDPRHVGACANKDCPHGLHNDA